MSDLLPETYTGLLHEIKARIQKAQYEALKAVNKELIALYWDIGRMIVERQEGETWGKAIAEQPAKDLQAEFPGMSGFSRKDSGVEWLGGVPEHWEVKRLKQIADIRLSNVDKHTVDGQQTVNLCNYVDVYKNEHITSQIDSVVHNFDLAEGRGYYFLDPPNLSS